MKPIRHRRALLAFASSALLSITWSSASVYTQSFTAADGTNDLGDGSVLKGNTTFNPTVQGNQLQLTADVINTNSAFHIPAIPGSSAGWTATFDFTITNGAGTLPAEGFSFSYGSIAAGTNSLRPEEGWPFRTALSFEIDTSVLGGNEVGPAMGLNRPFNASDSLHPSTIAHLNGDVMADDSSVSGTATIAWSPSAGASFTTTGLLTNANFSFVPTPGFTGDDAYRFAIAGRTTSAGSVEIFIDNVVICVGSADSDGDGLPNDWESANGLDPNSNVGVNGASGDFDGDTLTNLQEFNLGTKPNNRDTDEDGLDDNVENDNGSWGSASATGTDPLDDDSDDDTLLDGVETNTTVYISPTNTGTDPNNPNSDGDSKDDGEEVADLGRNPNVADDPDPDTVYIQNFDNVPNGAIDLGDGSALEGNAIVVNGALQLTTNTNSNSAAIHIPERLNSSMGWTATFDYTITEASSTLPADGFSFCYGALPWDQLSAIAEEGFPGISPCLSCEMDTYANGGGEVGPAIGVDRPNPPGDSSASAATRAFRNGNILSSNSTVTGTIRIVAQPSGVVSFTSTGALTNANFENISTGFVMDDAHTFAIVARTGGANQEVTIDNIEVVAGLPDSDGDGLFDLFEVANGLDPLDATGDNGATGDPDGDGLNNLGEQSAGTDPNDGDTDDDGLLDVVEDGGGVWMSATQTGTSPVNPDSDNDQLLDGVEDNGGVFVSITMTGTDPNNPNSDGDLALDGAELIIGRDPNIPDDPGPSSRYEQNFDAFPDGTKNLADNSTIGSTNDNSAAVIGGQLRLTEDLVGSTWGSFRTPPLLGSSQGWTASFDFTIIDSSGAENPADGFNFSYGAIPPLTTNDATPTGHGAAEEAWPGVDHLSFEIDSWDANSDWGVNIASEIGGLPTDHAYTAGSVLLDGQTVSGTATLSWNPTDGASFTTTGLLTNADFQNIDIPNFNPNDEYIFAFGARTGGATETLLIDNLVIETGAEPLKLDVVGEGPDLRFTWSSSAGKVYDLVTSPDLTSPINSWPVFEPTPGVFAENIPTTTPENTVAYPRPSAVKQFFAVIEKRAPAFFSDDFEGEDDNGWTWVANAADTGTTIWERGLPTSPFGPISGANDSDNCFATNLDTDYGNDTDISLLSPDLDLTAPGIAGATLSFFQYIDTDFFEPLPGEEPFGDFGIVRVIRASDGVQLGADVAGPFGGIQDWARFTVALPPEAVGEIIKLEFKFVADSVGIFTGWHIDEVSVDLE